MLHLFNSFGVVGMWVVASTTGFTDGYPYSTPFGVAGVCVWCFTISFIGGCSDSTLPMAIGAGLLGCGWRFTIQLAGAIGIKFTIRILVFAGSFVSVLYYCRWLQPAV